MGALTDVVAVLSNFEILDQSTQPFFVKDLKGVYKYCNDTFTELVGVEKNRFLGATAFDIFPSEHANIHAQFDRELFVAAASSQQYIGPIVLANLATHIATFKQNIIFDRKGLAAGILGTFILDQTTSPEGLASPINALTKKETTVLGYIAQGLSNKVIAEKCLISEHTVVSHVKAIYLKLDVHSRTEAVYKALIDVHSTTEAVYKALVPARPTVSKAYPPLNA